MSNMSINVEALCPMTSDVRLSHIYSLQLIQSAKQASHHDRGPIGPIGPIGPYNTQTNNAFPDAILVKASKGFLTPPPQPKKLRLL